MLNLCKGHMLMKLVMLNICKGHVYVKPLQETHADETCEWDTCMLNICKGHVYAKPL